MDAYNIDRKRAKELKRLKPDFVYSGKHGFELPGCQARFLTIPLETPDEEGNLRPAQAPLIIFFAKDTQYLDEETRVKLIK